MSQIGTDSPVDVDFWHHPHLARWAGWGVVLLALVLYMLTLDSGLRPDELSGGDLITHQYAQAEARPSNAPGYPLYTMGGWLWFRLTGVLLGWLLNPVQRLSTYSTLWACLALVVLYRLVLQATRGNWSLAALSTLFYAVTYFFWYYSVTTEQYTLAILQTLLIVWLAFRWDDQISQEEGHWAEIRGLGNASNARARDHLSPTKADGSESGPRRSGLNDADRTLLWLALVVGTCLANLVTTLFIVPPLLWFILSRRTGLLRRPGLLIALGGIGLLPVISYAYVYLRGAAHPEWWGAGQWPNAWAWFLDFVTTRQGREELAPGLTLSPLFTGEFPALVWGELTLVVLVGGLVGLWWLGRRRALLMAGTVVIYLVFGWVDRFGNWFQVFMPVYPLIVLGFAAGLNAIWVGRRRLPPRFDRSVPYLITLGLVVLVAYRFSVSLPHANQSWRSEDTGLEPGWAVLADRPEPDAVIVADNEEWLALSYLASVWGVQPRVYSQPLCQPGPRGGVDRGSSIYLTRSAAAADPTCMADRHRYAAGADLIRVQAAPNQQIPASARPVVLGLGPKLTLVGYETNRIPLVAVKSVEPRWQLSLYWQAEAPVSADYTVSVRPLQDGMAALGADGQPLIQDHQPVWNAYPTSRWLPGEVVRDDYVLSLPPRVVPDEAHIVVYRVVPDDTGGDHFETLGEIRLPLEP